MTHYDVIVVGAGSMGMAAGYFLAKEGEKVLLVDAFDPPHDQGSHSGETRLMRHAVGEGLEYVPLALRAQELWDELQEQTEQEIFMKIGVVSFGGSDAEFIAKGLEGRDQFGIEVEYFENARVLEEHFPDLNVPDDYHGFLEPNAGVLFSENAIATYRELALHEGAELSVNNPVTELEVSQESVTVTTKKDTFTGDKLLLSAGAYSNKLLPQIDLPLALQPSRRAIAWFDSDEELYASDLHPGFAAVTSSGTFYGFPSITGSGVKVGTHYTDDHFEPEYTDDTFGNYKGDENMFRDFLEEYLPGANGSLKKDAVCIYTMTKDENFVIDLHPEYSNVAVAAGFSGHGFKYASVVGEILSQLLTKGESDFDISLFSAQRRAVQV
jgi:N-methyl-L-tryptophan oxidase